jgi:hypothetical protein
MSWRSSNGSKRNTTVRVMTKVPIPKQNSTNIPTAKRIEVTELSGCRAQKNFGSEIGRSALTLVTGKAENVNQSDSSIPLAAAAEDTPPSCKVASISLLSPPTSCSDFLESVLMMKATENRLRHHSVSFRKLMPKFLQWHRKTWPRLWEPWSQARMRPALVVMSLVFF